MKFTSIPADWLSQIHRDGTSTLVTVSLTHLPCLPVRLDLHPNVELGIVLGGEIERIFPDTVISLHTGDVWLHPMWEPHGFSLPKPGHRSVVVLFQPGFLGEEMIGTLPWLALFAAPPRQRPRVQSDEARAEVHVLGDQDGARSGVATAGLGVRGAAEPPAPAVPAQTGVDPAPGGGRANRVPMWETSPASCRPSPDCVRSRRSSSRCLRRRPPVGWAYPGLARCSAAPWG